MKNIKQLAKEMSSNVWFKNPFESKAPLNLKPTHALPVEAKRLLNWIRCDYFVRHMPMSMSQLTRLSIGDLRTIARLLKPFSQEEMRDYDRSQLIRFIAGHQGDPGNYHALPPLPYGDLPDLE